jgi:hypothetical protein
MTSIESVARVSTVLLAAALSACGGGQTGGEVEGGTHTVEGPGHCNNVATPLASVDTVGPLGYAAADLLAFASGTHSARAAWLVHPMHDVHIDTGPEVGQTDVELDIRYAGGVARHVDSTPRPTTTEGPVQTCSDWLEVDVEVTLRTSGGALDEAWRLPLAGDLDSASVYRRFEPGELDGAFYANVVQPENGELKQFFIATGVGSDGKLSGQVSGVLEIAVEGGVTMAWVDYALWPAEAF